MYSNAITEYENVEIQVNKEDFEEIRTRDKGDEITIWKPASRPFRFVKSIRNMKFKFCLRKPNSNLVFSLSTVYHKDIVENINRIRYNVEKMMHENLPSEFNTYTYTENMFYKDKLSIWINKLKKRENDKFGNPMKVSVQENELFFENSTELMEYVSNKQADTNLDIYFEIFFNKTQKTWYMKPFIYSMDFDKDPKKDMSITLFNQLSFEDQKDFLSEAILNSLEQDVSKDMKIPSFQFRGLYFDFPHLLFSEMSRDVIGKKFQPNVWLGKKSKYDENSNAKESLIFVASDPVRTFIENVQKVLEDFLPQFTNTLTKKMKSVKLGKKDMIRIETPLMRHEEVVLDEDEEPQVVVGGVELYTLNVKQPYIEEDNTENNWSRIPSNLKYNILYPKIGMNKLWYDDKEKRLVLQLSISKYINIKPTENQSGSFYE
jgi:hypothetical protein